METRKGSLQNEFDLKSEIQSLKVEMKKTLDDMKEDLINTLKLTIQSEMVAINKRVSDQEEEIERLIINQEKLYKTCSKLESEFQKSKSNEVTNFSNYQDITGEVTQRLSRRQNIIISGLPEVVSDTLAERLQHDLATLESILKELGVTCSDAVSSAHRIGKIQDGKFRLLRVICSTVEYKSQILRVSRNLKKSEKFSSIFINPDQTYEERRERKKLRSVLMARKAAGEDVTIHQGKVILRESIKQNFHQSF